MMNWSNPLVFNKLSAAFIPEHGGVYAFWSDRNTNGQPIYIGQTSNLRQRFLQYCDGANDCVSKRANYFSYIPVASQIIRESMETDFIRRYNPPCNVQHKLW